MKKLIFVSVITFLLAMSFNAYSADETYMGLELGAATIEEDGIDTGFLGGFTYGGSFDNYRLEGELFYQVNGTDGSDDIKTLALLVNGYYDFNKESAWCPYIGIGLGYDRLDVGDDNDSDLIYGVSFGFSHELESTVLDIKYRYYRLENYDGTDGHSIVFSLRF
jgi:opacity protein-like surface antigen